MKYSIIIAVYNRIDEVKELLNSAEKLDFERDLFEILFVDDGSTDGFKDFVENYQSVSGLRARAIYQSNQGPGEARNNGMSQSQSDYFIFVDSDCMFPTHWLREIDNQLLENNYDAFGGPDTFHESFSPLVKAINYSMTSFIGTGGTRGGKKMVGKFYPRSFNMGLHRKVYKEIGGMSKLRHGQDMDFSVRIYDAGFKVGSIADAFVYHKRRTSLWKFFKQIFNWGVARINLGTQHPALLKIVHFFPSTVVFAYFSSVILAIFGGVFSFPYYLVNLGHLLICLWAFFESYTKYKSIQTAFLSIFTLNIQVFAYGMGLMYALFQKAIGRKEALGFVKNYYGVKK